MILILHSLRHMILHCSFLNLATGWHNNNDSVKTWFDITDTTTWESFGIAECKGIKLWHINGD